ncbi:MAG: mycothiol conjugate amidase Mca [Acidimicrobiales bacterium]
MSERLCLMAVHAHPDDESSKGAGTVARYHAEGVRTVLVCCTGGEEGDILNPAMDRPEVRENLAAVRSAELAAATAAIGYDDVELLGYRDSGMPGTPANERPDCFARAPLEEATARLAGLVRRYRPQVLLTYHKDQRGYPHPDHLRVHEVSVAAVDAAGDPEALPELGPAWRVSKLYYSVWSRARMRAIHAKFQELGIESPFDASRLDRPGQDDSITTRIDVSEYEDVRRMALLAHATQIDPASPWWFGLPPEMAREIWPWEEWELARSSVGPVGQEDDLFAGLRGGDRR